MKTILVLTDFSIKADHAAHYALKMAQKLHANILLCNVFLIPSSTGMATQVAWPMEDYGILEEDSDNDLTEFVGRLNRELDAEITDNPFRPSIDHCSRAGYVIDNVNQLAQDKNIIMTVIGTHHHNGLSSWLSGDHAQGIIEKANCPVLLVPEQARLKDFKRIAFATDLSNRDIDVLHSLSGLAKFYNADILLTHVADEGILERDQPPVVRMFLAQVTSKINYPKIYYRAVKGKNVINSLDWVADHIDIDLLVMVHHKLGFFQRIFEGSVTQKMANHLSKPLLVFPCSGMEYRLPVF